MESLESCPWCGTHQDVSGAPPHWCRHCQHRLGVRKDECDCLMCDQIPTALRPTLEGTRDEQARFYSQLTISSLEDAMAVRSGHHATIGKIDVTAPQFLNPRAGVTVYPSRVIVRVTDALDSTKLVELVISDEEVERWFKVMELGDDLGDDQQAPE